MRISQLAERSGVPATTLRFYETAGLLPAERTPAGYRVYGQEAIERLSLAHLDALPDRARRCDPECGCLTPAAQTGPVPLEPSPHPDRPHLNGSLAHLEVRAPAGGAALLTDLFGTPAS